MRILDTASDDRLREWIRDSLCISDVRPGPLLTGGNANVTRIIYSNVGDMVLRHAPANSVSDKAAAGIRREYDLLCALDGAAPIPKPLAYCEDTSVLGAAFALTSFVPGASITESLPAAYADNPETIGEIGRELVDGIAAVHALDWRARLPADFGRPEGFLRRQIDRWLLVRSKDAVRELPLLDQLGQWLIDNQPSDGTVGIVHCDYHLDNCLFDTSAPVLRAIIDWEMATIGDPMIDLGLLLMFWNRSEEDNLGFRFVQRISNRPGVISRQVMADRWAMRTGYSAARLDYYRIFAFWRLAAIVEGANVLRMRGLVDSDYARGLEQDVPNLLHEAAALAG